MAQRCGAAPDLSTEEPWNNSLTSENDRFGEFVSRYSRILGSQISVLTQLILPPELLQKIIENYFRGVGFEPMPSRMVFRRANRYTTTTRENKYFLGPYLYWIRSIFLLQNQLRILCFSLIGSRRTKIGFLCFFF